MTRISLSVFGINHDWYVPIAQSAERAGFEAIWLSEHLATPLEYRRIYPYNESGEPGYTSETPLNDVWPLLGAISATTTSIQLGTGVLILPIRNPFLTAHAACTVQNLSHGRFLFGIGTGWMEEEFEVLGEPFAARGARTDEILDVMEKLWTGRPTSHQGRFYSFPPVQHPPAPVRPIPILGCGLSEGMLQRTAQRANGWYGPAIALDRSIEAVAKLDQLRTEFGRQETEFRCFIRLDGPLDDSNLERHQAAGVEHLVLSFAAIRVPGAAGLEQQLDTIADVGGRFARNRRVTNVSRPTRHSGEEPRT